ncbi:MAG: hypothetical protein IIA49_17400 [Bacteroidetes bacterium]|nr:hypothetical protein [Bacteroidota bacterium]
MSSSAKVLDNLKKVTNGDSLPTTERQARELALLGPEQQVEVWEEIIIISISSASFRHNLQQLSYYKAFKEGCFIPHYMSEINRVSFPLRQLFLQFFATSVTKQNSV